MIISRLLICLMVSTVTFLIILLIKKVFKKQLSAKWEYNLWFLFLVSLTLPFIPNKLFNFNNFFTSFSVKQNNIITPSAITSSDHTFENINWMQDFTTSVIRYNTTSLNNLLFFLWIAGMLVFTAISIHSWLRIKNIRRSITLLDNKQYVILFEQCKQHLHVKKHLIVGVSPLVSSPMTFGLYKTYIVLPSRYEECLTLNDVKYIFLHELNHYKSKDIILSYLMIIFQILYWFNPLVWIAFREMILDREIACDTAVLQSLDKHCYKEYGNTIINFIEKTSKSRTLALENHLNGSREQIKNRIQRIASYKTESKQLKLKSISIFIFVAVLVVAQFPVVSAMTYDNNRYEFNSKHVDYENLSKYFADYEGSFVLYNKKTEQYNIYNKNKSTLRISPDSTYKIYSALYGLESNTISSENSTFKWNGIIYPSDTWNKDQSLSTAMKNSTTWYFQELDKKVELEKIQAFLNSINYGNHNLSGGIDQYWLESSLKISPVEQVQLLQAFYTNQLGLKPENIKTVKDTIKLEEKDGAILSGKTGTGTVNGKNMNGWFIGYVETEQNTYFFATNIQHGSNSNGKKAAEVTLSILRDKGIY
jgi:bla regulator protein blaR1